MNSKTAKLLARGAACLALVQISNMPGSSQWSVRKRAEVSSTATQQIYETYKCKWKGMPWTERTKVRRFLKQLVAKTRASYRRASK